MTVDLRALRQAPSSDYRLGTDLIGRDVWSRVVYGERTSLSIGILGVALYALIGSFLGALAGYYGGLLDQIIMRLTDTLMSIPSLLLIILFVSVVGPSLTAVIIVIGLLGWPVIASSRLSVCCCGADAYLYRVDTHVDAGPARSPVPTTAACDAQVDDKRRQRGKIRWFHHSLRDEYWSFGHFDAHAHFAFGSRSEISNTDGPKNSRKWRMSSSG